MTDKEIKQRILDEFEWEPSVAAEHIGVIVENGVVTLTGHVATYAEKLAAEQAAKRVKGVKALAIDIDVRLPSTHAMDDADIAKRAVDSLSWNASVPRDRIQPLVQDGCITLRGEVDWQFQRQAAENAVRVLAGVKAVVNQISITQQLQPEGLQRRIQAALARSASVEAKGVTVKIANGRVAIEGEVHSWHDRDAVEDAVWAAPGVTSVVNLLRVDTAPGLTD